MNKNKLRYSDKKFLIKCWKFRNIINDDNRFFNALLIASQNKNDVLEINQSLSDLFKLALSKVTENKDLLIQLPPETKS
jgi:hypothetical protein